MSLTLQELITRARFFLNNSPKRYEVFYLVNGKKSAKEISDKTHRSLSVVLQDLQKMRDLELVIIVEKNGKMVKKSSSFVYEKNALLKHISHSLLKDPTKIPTNVKKEKRVVKKVKREIYIPNEKEILDICREGEGQTYEFKRAGVDTRTLAKEACAFANTKEGGLIFYGVEDDGTIGCSDKKKAVLDQSLNNAIQNTITPSLIVKIISREVAGNLILIIAIPPWDKKRVYHYEQRVCIRKGTNVFYAKQEESETLFAGTYVV